MKKLHELSEAVKNSRITKHYTCRQINEYYKRERAIFREYLIDKFVLEKGLNESKIGQKITKIFCRYLPNAGQASALVQYFMTGEINYFIPIFLFCEAERIAGYFLIKCNINKLRKNFINTGIYRANEDELLEDIIKKENEYLENE